jgi:lysylphosphatidylglycerol synthetase-like protein (DUF2156 family)
MIIIGLLVLIAALIFGVDLVFQNHSHHITSPVVFGQSLGVTNRAAVFIIGAITGAAILLALVLMASGIRHRSTKAATHRMERKEAKGTRGQRDKLVSDNERLRSDLAKERAPEDALPDDH